MSPRPQGRDRDEAPLLCILTQYFPPEMGAPQARLSELGELLVDLGWRVEALTALPNYPTGRLFPGYRPLTTAIEQVGRIRTVRVPLLPSRRGMLARLLTYFSFVASAAVLGPRHCRHPDLLLVESPPLFIGLAARFLAWRWRVPFVFNVSDLWPQSFVHMGYMQEGIATGLARRLETSLYLAARAVTGQSDEIAEEVRRRAPGTPVAVITNGVDPGRFAGDCIDPETSTDADEGPVFVYAGLLGIPQGLDQILDLAAALPDSVPGRFLLVGDGARREHLKARIENEDLRRVKLEPAVQRDAVPGVLGSADVAVICLGWSIPGSVPSKIYEAMAAALPILLIAEGEAARRVEAAECGIVVSPGDSDAALAACRRLVEDADLRRRLGRNGRKAAEETYDRRRIAARLDRFLRRFLADPP